MKDLSTFQLLHTTLIFKAQTTISLVGALYNLNGLDADYWGWNLSKADNKQLNWLNTVLLVCLFVLFLHIALSKEVFS